MAVYGAIHRRCADVGRAEECAALDAALRALAARGGRLWRHKENRTTSGND